jgi:hypothetical protein
MSDIGIFRQQSGGATACYSAGAFLWSCLPSAQADPENVPSPVQSHPHTDGSEKNEAAKEPGFADILTKEQHKAKGICE